MATRIKYAPMSANVYGNYPNTGSIKPVKSSRNTFLEILVECSDGRANLRKPMQLALQSGKVSRVFLWSLALILFVVLGWYFVVPIAMMAPSTNHYKMVKPFSAAIALELGEPEATSLILGEGLGYCSYLPVQMCVKLSLKKSQVDDRKLEVIRQITRNICNSLDRASPTSLGSIGVMRDQLKATPQQVQQKLLGYAGCDKENRSFYREISNNPPAVETDTVILTFVGVPTNLIRPQN